MEQIKGLCLLCPLIYPGYRQGKAPPKTVLEKDPLFLTTLSQEDRRGFEYLSVIQTPEMWKCYKNDIDLSMLPDNIGFLGKQLDGKFSADSNTVNIQYNRPTLIRVSKQDTEVGYENQYDAFKDYQRATILVLDKAGHNLQTERKTLFVAAFLDWIERIDTIMGDAG